MAAKTLRSITALLLAGAWLTAQSAPPVTVFRCVDPEGRVSLQDVACPPGQREQRRDLPAPPAGEPMALPPVASPPPPAPEAVPAPAAAPVAPPPPLWECETWDGKTYDSETADTVPRCVPLAVMGWDMRGLPPEQAAACQWVRDRCRRLDAAAACTRWRFLRAQAERELRFAFSDTRAQAEAEFARLDAIVDTHCR